MVGESNHHLSKIKQADEVLKAHGLKLSAEQNHYSLDLNVIRFWEKEMK